MSKLKVKKILAYLFLILSMVSLSFKWISVISNDEGNMLAGVIYDLADGNSFFDLSAISDQLYDVAYIVEDGGVSISEGRQIVGTVSKGADILLDYGDSWGILEDKDIVMLKVIKLASPIYTIVFWGTILVGVYTLVCYLLKRKSIGGVIMIGLQCIFTLIVLCVIGLVSQKIDSGLLSISYGMVLGVASSIASTILWKQCVLDSAFATNDTSLKAQVIDLVDNTKNIDYKNLSNTVATTLDDTKRKISSMGNWTCPTCGSKMGASNKFCTSCGTQKPSPVFCPSCGQQFAANEQFCPKCGTKRPE